MARKPKVEKHLATFDIETDPFKAGRAPKPFCCGLKYRNDYVEWWGDDCLIKFYHWLKIHDDEPLLIYAHNGGKFDFMYLFWMGIITDIKLINGRIVKAKIGNHELRDSYSIIPIPLAAYQKDEIDYKLFEKEVREKNKADILHYLAKDCEYLYDLVERFRERFGDALTIGGAALKELRSLHPFENQNKRHDDIFRKFYFGGRVEYFKAGILKGKFKVFDVNSMYPSVMYSESHPKGSQYITTTDLELAFEHPMFFIEFVGKSTGALPVRTKAGLDFTNNEGVFYTTSHELKIALKHNLVEIDKIIEILIPVETVKFDLFVKRYAKEKEAAKKEGRKADEIFAKTISNSSYGKFGQNPDNFYDYIIRYPDEPVPDLDEYELFLDTGYLEVWRTPAPKPTYYDVAVAASITGAARAVLLDAICNAVNPLYCDTDSIICEELAGVVHHKTDLGAWDCEAPNVDTLAIAGKKLYAAFDNGVCVKKANKGCKISANDIVEIAKGKSVVWKNEAPSFSLSGKINFIERTITKRF